MNQESRIPNPAFNHQYDFEVVEAIKKNEVKEKYTYAEMAIGKNRKKYLAIFKDITNGKFFIPSVKAGIFGFSWLIYRRAAYYSVIPYLILMLLSFNLFAGLSLSIFIKFLIIMLAPNLIFYFIGNFLYWRSVRIKVKKYRKAYGETSALLYLSEQGGVLTGFNLISSIFLAQGSVAFLVYINLQIDDFMINLGKNIAQLAGLN